MYDDSYFLKPIAIKPLAYAGGIIYKEYVDGLGTIAFRSFELDRDETMIHDWVNRDYALRYWQLDGDRRRVRDTYYAIQRSGEGHSFIGLLNGVPICQFDVYRVLADEIQEFITAPGPQDCGFHLLMAPNERPIPGLSVRITRAMLRHYFQFPEAERMYAEPDVTNPRSNRILQQVGFQLVESIKMSYKTANLYVLTREQFFNHQKV
jgi:acetyl CoA:N6-hydroxylysine acetyl transferase